MAKLRSPTKSTSPTERSLGDLYLEAVARLGGRDHSALCILHRQAVRALCLPWLMAAATLQASALALAGWGFYLGWPFQRSEEVPRACVVLVFAGAILAIIASLVAGRGSEARHRCWRKGLEAILRGAHEPRKSTAVRTSEPG